MVAFIRNYRVTSHQTVRSTSVLISYSAKLYSLDGDLLLPLEVSELYVSSNNHHAKPFPSNKQAGNVSNTYASFLKVTALFKCKQIPVNLL